MNKIIIFLLLLISTGSFAQMRRSILQKGEPKNERINEVDIYILIGDSNQSGALVEPVGMDAKYLNINPNPRVRIFYKPDRGSTENGEWQKYSLRATADEDINRTPGTDYAGACPCGFGQDQAFTYRLYEASPRLSAIIKMAKGGSSLITQSSTDNDWQRSGDADATPFGAELYSSYFFAYLNQGLKALRREDIYGVRHGKQTIRGIVIRLGTNDCLTSLWNNTNFVNGIPIFVDQIRSKTRQDLPIYWVQVHDDLGSEPLGDHPGANVTAARLALTNCESGGSTPITGFTLLNYDAHTLQADGVHFDEDSYESQGVSEANTLMP
jgi:hypothetical protein